MSPSSWDTRRESAFDDIRRDSLSDEKRIMSAFDDLRRDSAKTSSLFDRYVNNLVNWKIILNRNNNLGVSSMTNPYLLVIVNSLVSQGLSMMTTPTRYWSMLTSTRLRSWSSRRLTTLWWWRLNTRRRHLMVGATPLRALARVLLCLVALTLKVSNLLFLAKVS